MYTCEDVAYVQGRLIDTIITLKGKAVLVSNVEPNSEEGICVVSVSLVEGDVFASPLSDYDLTPVKIGWVNNNEEDAIYITRAPMRKDWRQGLRGNNIRGIVGGKEVDNSNLGRTIEGDFPPLQALLEDTPEVITAWHRHFAIDSEKHIHYRGFGVVGEFIGRQKEYVLNAQYGWVEEHLREVI